MQAEQRSVRLADVGVADVQTPRDSKEAPAMRICQVTYTGFGGLGSVVFSLIAGDTRGNAWSVAFVGDQPLEPSYQRQCTKLGIPFAVFRSTPGRPFAAWARLTSWLAKTRPDVVICHSINSVLACRVYAWLHGARLVCVEHTANQVKTGSERMASKLCMILADRLIVLTPQYRDELERAHGWLYRASKVRVIPNGIDLGMFHPPSRLRIGGSKLRMGMAGRFSFSKRQDMLIEVARRVAERMPEKTVELSFAGDGDELHRVQERVAASSGSAQFTFEGLLREDEVADWLRGLDLYVHATDGETLSTSLLQAMACGVPIVASDVPGVRNLLGAEGEYGTSVPNDIDAFADAIVRLAQDEGRARNQAGRALAHVQKTFGLVSMWRAYSEAISK